MCMSAKILPFTETEKKHQQTSSRTERLVFATHPDKMDSLVLCNIWFHMGLSQTNSLWKTFFLINSNITKVHQALSAMMNRVRPTYSHWKHLSCNLWPISENVWDWLLFTEECLCSSKMENYFITWETWWKVKLPAKKADKTDKTKIWKCSYVWKSHLCIEEYVRMREISHCDVISEMWASKVIFRWKLNCKRQSRICLSLPF